MSDLIVSPNTLASAVLPRLSAQDVGPAERRSVSATPSVEVTLSPASERILELIAQDRDTRATAGREDSAPASTDTNVSATRDRDDEGAVRSDLVFAERTKQITARPFADRDEAGAQRTERVDEEVATARVEQTRRIEESVGADNVSKDLVAARSVQNLSTRNEGAEVAEQDRSLAGEITNVAAVVRDPEDALVAPARLANLLERLQAARPTSPVDGALLAGEAFPLPEGAAPSVPDGLPGLPVTQGHALDDALGGADRAVMPPGPRSPGTPEGTVAGGTQGEEVAVAEGRANEPQSADLLSTGSFTGDDAAMANPSSSEDTPQSGPTSQELAEQTTQRAVTHQDGLEERGVEQDEVERAVGRKAEVRRAQEGSRADEVFEELAATQVAANLVARIEVADAVRSDAADAAAQDQLLADEIAQVAAAASAAEDEIAAPVRLADFLERMQVARPTAAVNTTLEAGEAFLLPKAMPTVPDTAMERADAADPRPNPAPFATPEDAAPPSMVGAQAERRTAEPSSAELTAEQDASLRRTQMSGDTSTAERRAPSREVTQPDTLPEARHRVSATAAIQGSPGEADANGQSNTPAGRSKPGLVAVPTHDEASMTVPRALSGQMLNLSV